MQPYIARILILLLITVSLTGCNKYLRLAKLGTQFCFYEDNFMMTSVAGVPQLHMHQPVMLDTDMDAFLAARPSQVHTTGDRKRALYELQSVSDRRGRVHTFGLEYQRDRGNWRLAGGAGDRHIAEIVPLALMEQSFRSICSSDTHYSLRQIEFDLTDIQTDLIPRWQAIRQIIGPPLALETISEGDTRYHARYEFRLISEPEGQGRLFLDLYFNARGELLRNTVRYSNYAFDADFQIDRAQLKLI